MPQRSTRFSLPYLPLLTSVVISAISFGIMVPHTSRYPLLLYMVYTGVFHSLLLVSSIFNKHPGDGKQFYMNPIGNVFIVWSACIALVWTSVPIQVVYSQLKGTPALSSAAGDIPLGALATVEAVLNFYFLILCLKEWRRSSNSNTEADCEIGINVDSL